MAEISQSAVLDALRSVKLPGSGGDIVSAGLVSGIFIANGKVFFSINAPVDQAQMFETVRAQAESVVKSMPGVASAVAALTAEKKAGSGSP